MHAIVVTPGYMKYYYLNVPFFQISVIIIIIAVATSELNVIIYSIFFSYVAQWYFWEYTCPLYTMFFG